MTSSNIFYFVFVMSLSVFITERCVGQTELPKVDDTVFAQIARNKTVFIAPQGNHIVCWNSEQVIDGKNDAETTIYPATDVSEKSSFKLTSRRPWRITFSKDPNGREFDLRHSVTGIGFTLMETSKGVATKTYALDLVSNSAVLEGVATSNVAIIKTEKEVFGFSWKEGTLRKLLRNTQITDTIAIDPREAAILYFPSNSVDAGFAFSFKSELAPLFVLPGFTAYSEDKIVQEGDNRIPKLYSPPQGHAELAAFNSDAKISGAIVHRAFSEPCVFVWKNDLLVDMLYLPPNHHGQFMGFDGDRLLVISSDREKNESKCMVIEIIEPGDNASGLRTETSMLSWKCVSAGFCESQKSIIAVDQENRIHQVKLGVSKP